MYRLSIDYEQAIVLNNLVCERIIDAESIIKKALPHEKIVSKEMRKVQKQLNEIISRRRDKDAQIE